LEGNDQVVAVACTAGWAIALIVLIIVRHSIPASSHWWFWTCGVGLGLGLFAMWYVPRLKRSRAKTAARRAAVRSAAAPSAPTSTEM
jgi:H+/Cl- antiporter ClcA